MRCTLLSLVVVSLILHPKRASAADKSETPVLIIAGTGINSKETDQELFYHVQQMFGAAAKGFKPTTVTFNADQARPHGLNPISARLDNSAAQQIAGGQIGEIVARNRKSILRLDMDLYGVDVAVSKGVAGEYERVSPTLVAQHLALNLAGQRESSRQLGDQHDKLRTRWNQETERAAVFIEKAAEEFKKQYPDGKVVIVGHSAFTNAVDLVPLGPQTKPLIDFRVMSSPMVREFKEHDPSRTLIVTHDNDLPAANMGNIHSPRSQVGLDLTREGTVLQIKGTPTASPFTMVDAHSETYQYTRIFNMEVKTSAGNQPFLGSLSDLVNRKMDAALQGTPLADGTFLKTLKQETPKEHRVGGVTLSKPAFVPLDPEQIRGLDLCFGYSPAFLLKSGAQIRLPDIDSEVGAAALACVLAEMPADGRDKERVCQPPELTLFPIAAEDGTSWMAVGYYGMNWRSTKLGDLLLEADRTIAHVAFGQTTAYQAPAGIPNYHPYCELALDNGDWTNGTRMGRAWIVPAKIRMGLKDEKLVAEECQFAVRFESFPTEQAAAHLDDRINAAVPDPAGDFLAQQLTDHFDDLAKEHKVLHDLAPAAAFVGVLLWARENGIRQITPQLLAWIKEKHKYNPQSRAYGPAERLMKKSKADGREYEVVPWGEPRKFDSGDVIRPAALFNRYGISRLLWPDGTESKIEYDAAGRMRRLHSRRPGVTELLYDEEGKPVAIADETGHGVAILWRDRTAAACYWAAIDVERLECVPLAAAAMIPLPDVPGYLDHWVKDWMTAEAAFRDDSGYQQAVKTAGTTRAWLRWSHTRAQLQCAAFGALLLTSVIFYRYYRRQGSRFEGVREHFRKGAPWIAFPLCTGTIGLLLVFLEVVPVGQAVFRDQGWFAFALYVALPGVTLLCCAPHEDGDYRLWESETWLVVYVALGILVVVAVCLPEALNPFKLALGVSAGIIVCRMLFCLYQHILPDGESYTRLPMLCLLFALAGTALTVSHLSEVVRGWHAGILPEVPSFTQTSGLLLAQLVDVSRPAAEPRAGLLLPILGMAALAVLIETCALGRIPGFAARMPDPPAASCTFPAKMVVAIVDLRPVELILAAGRRVSLKRLKQLLRCREVRLAREDEIAKLFPGCDLGAIPFRRWDNIDVLMDESLQTGGNISFQATGPHQNFDEWIKLINPRVASFVENREALQGTTIEAHQTWSRIKEAFDAMTEGLVMLLKGLATLGVAAVAFVLLIGICIWLGSNLGGSSPANQPLPDLGPTDLSMPPSLPTPADLGPPP